MQISEMIARLQEIQEKEGDLDIFTCDENWNDEAREIEDNPAIYYILNDNGYYYYCYDEIEMEEFIADDRYTKEDFTKICVI